MYLVFLKIYTFNFLFILLHMARSLYCLTADVAYSAVGILKLQERVSGKGHLNQNLIQIRPNPT